MKKMLFILAAVSLACSAPLAAFAMDHDMSKHGSDSMMMDKGGEMQMGKPAHVAVADGVKASFYFMDIKAKMQALGMKETNHIMVMFADAKTGKMLPEGVVKVKVLGPDKSEQLKDLMGMRGGFGADFTLAQKGKYGVMCKFKLADGKVRSAKFWYQVK